MILIARGRDVHTNRLVKALEMLGKPYKLVTTPEEIVGNRFELAFIDPSFNYDISTSLKADKTIFYDCEDSPTDFFPGIAYHTLKCKSYAKISFIDNDRNDGIKNIGMPIFTYLYLAEVANKFPSETSMPNEYVPTFIGHPTFIGKYPLRKKIEHKNNNPFGIKIISDTNIYNQRYDWLVSLRKNKLINHTGTGIVFQNSNTNMSLEWQTQMHGDVKQLGINKVDYLHQLDIIRQLKIGLCPTGHERFSWRFLDIMAVGSILFITDFSNQRHMYMPKEYIIVKDEEDLATKILDTQKDFPELYKAAQKNREFMKTLTPERIWNDFCNSIE